MKVDDQHTSGTSNPTTFRLGETLNKFAFTLSFWVVLVTVLTSIGWVLLQVFRELAWTLAAAPSYLGAVGGIVAVPLVGLAILETVSRLKPDAKGAHASTTPRRGRTRLLLCSGSAAVVISGNLCLNIAASRIDAHYQNRKQEGVDIYRNHDLAKLVGQCVRLAILRHADGLRRGDERTALESIAAIAPAQWSAMTDTDGNKQPDPRVLALADAKLTQFIQVPKAEALHRDQWVSLLVDWRAKVKVNALTDATLNAAASTIARDFGVTLREALKADFEKGGKAWAAMQLDIAQQLLNRTPVSMATGNPEIHTVLAEVKGLLADEAKGLPALHRTILDARQAQDEHARAITRNFDQVVGMLQRVRDDLQEIKASIDVLKSGVDTVGGEVIATKSAVESAHGDIREVLEHSTSNDEIAERRDEHGRSLLSDDYAIRARNRDSTGDLEGAERDITRSIRLQAAGSKNQWFTPLTDYEFRASVRLRRGNLIGAEQDILYCFNSIGSDAKDTSSDARCCFTRAAIRRLRGDLVGAEQDILKYIAWHKKWNFWREDDGVASHVLWGKIQNDLGEHQKALVTIEQCLTWARAKKPSVDDLVAAWTCEKANVLVELDRIPEAVADMATCIDWYRKDQSDNKPLMARFLRDQARILAAAAKQGVKEGDWAAADAAIDESLPLHVAVFGKDHEWTKKARAWQSVIARREVPPRWLDTKP